MPCPRRRQHWHAVYRLTSCILPSDATYLTCFAHSFVFCGQMLPNISLMLHEPPLGLAAGEQSKSHSSCPVCLSFAQLTIDEQCLRALGAPHLHLRQIRCVRLSAAIAPPFSSPLRSIFRRSSRRRACCGTAQKRQRVRRKDRTANARPSHRPLKVRLIRRPILQLLAFTYSRIPVLNQARGGLVQCEERMLTSC